MEDQFTPGIAIARGLLLAENNNKLFEYVSDRMVH